MPETSHSHSMPTDVPLVPGIDNVPRTPRTPHGTLLDRQDPRFYPVVKDGTKPDPQVNIGSDQLFRTTPDFSNDACGGLY